MKHTHRQSGFSLMEVMFGVVVLALGLVFVACQFPVGLSQSRDVLEMTTSQIDAHNAGVMTKLRLSSLPSRYFGLNNAAPDPNFVIMDKDIHMLCHPNWRWASQDVVMDDPSGKYFAKIPAAPAQYTPSTGSPVIPGELPLPTYISVDPDILQLYAHNLGTVVWPTVDYNDPDIQQRLWALPGYPDSFDMDQLIAAFNTAVFEEVASRKYSTCELYKCVNPQSRTFQIYTFVLRHLKSGTRFGIQNTTVQGFIEPFPLDATEDRMFPVPWYVNLDTFVINDPENPPVPGFWDRFYVNTYVANLLRQGSILIDADAPLAFPTNGFVYEVKEVLPTATTDVFLVKLTDNLQDVLQYFWVFPPPVERASNGNFMGYGEQTPVVSLTQRTITLD